MNVAAEVLDVTMTVILSCTEDAMYMHQQIMYVHQQMYALVYFLASNPDS